MQKRILTEEDFNNNPALAGQGLKIGDEIEIPDKAVSANTDGLAADDDTGGSAPPPNKEG